MSLSSVGGGFQGTDALLAFAAVQQGRMNDQMTDAMRIADLRSQAAGDLADIKSHLEEANRYPQKFGDVDTELQAFMDKYGSVPELDDLTSTVGEIADNVHKRCTDVADANRERDKGFDEDYRVWENNGKVGDPPTKPDQLKVTSYAEESIQNWLGKITDKLDAAGTNDQLTMIHIKTLNDNIGNSSGMISGIIESRQNTTASIINNIA